MIGLIQKDLQRTDTTLDGLERHRASLESRLTQVDQGIAQYAARQAVMQEAINRRKAVLHPIRRLPAEILCQIFTDALEWPIQAEWKNAVHHDPITPRRWWFFKDEDRLPWALELVCRSWRAAALGDPTLWSFINIVVSDRNFSPLTPAYMTRLGTQLYRSHRAQRLSVTITLDPTSWTGMNLPIALSTILLPCAPRIHDLYLNMPIRLVGGLSMLKNMFVLNRLRIHNMPYEPQHSQVDQETIAAIFRESTSLCHLDTVDMPPPHLGARLATLVDVNILHGATKTATRPIGLRAFIAHTPNLERLFVDLAGASPGGQRPMPHTSRRLKGLTLRIRPQTPSLALKQLFDGLLLPVLEELSVVRDNKHGSWPNWRAPSDTFVEMVETLERSQCPLRILKLEVMPPDWTMAHIDRLLLATPRTTTFSLKLPDDGGIRTLSSLLRPLMALDADNQMKWPVLEHLILEGNWTLDVDVEEVLDMVLRRQDAPALRSMSLSFKDVPPLPLGFRAGQLEPFWDALRDIPGFTFAWSC